MIEQPSWTAKLSLSPAKEGYWFLNVESAGLEAKPCAVVSLAELNRFNLELVKVVNLDLARDEGQEP